VIETLKVWAWRDQASLCSVDGGHRPTPARMKMRFVTQVPTKSPTPSIKKLFRASRENPTPRIRFG
jgi:hypothetical protein